MVPRTAGARVNRAPPLILPLSPPPPFPGNPGHQNELVKAKRLNTRLASEVGKYQTMLGKENADGDTATEAELRRALQATYEAKKKLSSELEDLTQSVLDITAHSGTDCRSA